MAPRKDTVTGMRTLAATLVVAAMLLVPLGLLGTASGAGTDRDLTPIVIGPVPTDRFGGGGLVAVKAGDALFGVRYGMGEHPNDLLIFAEYKRFLGGADVVDAQGNYLATRGIPVYTVLAQSLVRFIEFQARNGSDGFDLTSLGTVTRDPLTANVPVKALNLTTAWEVSEPTNVTVDRTTYVNFTVSATDLHYTRILNGTNLGDGMLNRVAFTFHLTVGQHDRRAEIPWFRVTVGGGDRSGVSHVEFLGYRNVTGPGIGMGAKYDHWIEGWDFASPESRLALETHLLFGNLIPDRTAAFIHALLRERADDGEHELGDARTLNETDRVRPRLYTRDRVYFDDDYARIGRFEWATNVTVDGVDTTMTFNVQGGGSLRLDRGGATFLGFWLRGAFVYPAGDVIEHDPLLSAEAFLDLPSAVNLTPMTILAAQLAVVGLAMGPALYLRAKARRSK